MATTTTSWAEAAFFDYSAYDDFYYYAMPTSPPATPLLRPAKRIKIEKDSEKDLLLLNPTSSICSSEAFVPTLIKSEYTPPLSFDDTLNEHDPATPTTPYTMAIPTTTITTTTTPPPFNPIDDFFVEFDSSLLSATSNAENWKLIVTEIRRQIFNSTSVAFPAPSKLLQKIVASSTESDSRNNSAQVKMRVGHSPVSSQASLDPTAPSTTIRIDNNADSNDEEDNDEADPLMYRKLRSENLLLRLIHHQKLDLQNQVSLMRLSKGVFVHQKWQPMLFEPVITASPTSSLLSIAAKAEGSSSYYSPTITATPTAALSDTSDYHGPSLLDAAAAYNSMTQKLLDEDAYIPYSYTFGVRYTNPYTQAKDVAIRGRLPLWSQTLFLSECVRQQESKQWVIQPDVPYAGLFPFAPHIAVTFHPILAPVQEQQRQPLVEPELALAYERLTMDQTNIIDLFNSRSGDNEQQCSEQHRQKVLCNMFVCNIPDDISQQLTDLATLWAASKGIFV